MTGTLIDDIENKIESLHLQNCSLKIGQGPFGR